ncbi:hypothetical protein HanRHA438_Chr15g0696601 [Helianthus annuus]|nr:hypothetical protein HanRHA438_Chr15g0696601 [Helianthus annuus]
MSFRGPRVLHSTPKPNPIGCRSRVCPSNCLLWCHLGVLAAMGWVFYVQVVSIFWRWFIICMHEVMLMDLGILVAVYSKNAKSWSHHLWSQCWFKDNYTLLKLLFKDGFGHKTAIQVNQVHVSCIACCCWLFLGRKLWARHLVNGWDYNKWFGYLDSLLAIRVFGSYGWHLYDIRGCWWGLWALGLLPKPLNWSSVFWLWYWLLFGMRKIITELEVMHQSWSMFNWLNQNDGCMTYIGMAQIRGVWLLSKVLLSGLHYVCKQGYLKVDYIHLWPAFTDLFRRFSNYNAAILLGSLHTSGKCWKF